MIVVEQLKKLPSFELGEDGNVLPTTVECEEITAVMQKNMAGYVEGIVNTNTYNFEKHKYFLVIDDASGVVLGAIMAQHNGELKGSLYYCGSYITITKGLIELEASINENFDTEIEIEEHVIDGEMFEKPCKIKEKYICEVRIYKEYYQINNNAEKGFTVSVIENKTTKRVKYKLRCGIEYL